MFERRVRWQMHAGVLAGAAGAGVVVGLLGSWFAARRWMWGLLRSLERIEEEVVARLRADPDLSGRAIEVAGLGDGILELSGMVHDESESHRAVELAQAVPGVRTVLNRLTIEMLETHLRDTRQRFDAGAPRLHETHWYGQGVGTGRRRQSRSTDPRRPDEKVRTVTRALGTDRATELSSEALEKLGPAVEGHSTTPAGPTDRGTAYRTSHRRLGNVPADPIQDLNPEARIHRPVKKGTATTLDESGAARELRRREDRG